VLAEACTCWLRHVAGNLRHAACSVRHQGGWHTQLIARQEAHPTYQAAARAHPPTNSLLVGLNIMMPMLKAEPASGNCSKSSVRTVGFSWSEDVRMSASGYLLRTTRNTEATEKGQRVGKTASVVRKVLMLLVGAVLGMKKPPCASGQPALMTGQFIRMTDQYHLQHAACVYRIGCRPTLAAGSGVTELSCCDKGGNHKIEGRTGTDPCFAEPLLPDAPEERERVPEPSRVDVRDDDRHLWGDI